MKSGFTHDEMLRLAGAGFNAVLARDPELARLESLKYDKSLHARVLLGILAPGSIRIGKLPSRPLTAAKWAFLWMLENPFASSGEVTETDLDIFLFVLSCPDVRTLDCAVHEIPALASGYAMATGLPVKELVAEIRSEIRGAFLALEMLPPGSSSGEEPRFDAMWATHIAGTAARESGMPFDYCLHEMTLGACCCFFVNMLRREETAGSIRFRADEAIQLKISERIDVLAKQFLKG